MHKPIQISDILTSVGGPIILSPLASLSTNGGAKKNLANLFELHLRHEAEVKIRIVREISMRNDTAARLSTHLRNTSSLQHVWTSRYFAA